MLVLAIIIGSLLSSTISTDELDYRSLPESLQDEVYLTAPELIAKYKYPVEVHNVTTADGYILTLHRILPRHQPSKGSVLLMHGIVASSDDWILTGPAHGLGYLLSNEGYDVWLGNARGNKYSRNHTTLDPDEYESFWEFSWHEIGIYDLPAMIDHIILTTKEEKIFYVAHSQGTTVFYVMCSKKPEYNKKIRAQFSLAPVAFVSHMASPILRFLASANFLLEGVANFINLNELLSHDGVISFLGKAFCSDNPISEMLCSNTLFAICGFNYKQLNTTILPLILAHDPAGSSAKQLLHFTQLIRSGRFREYDYGFYSNVRRYGQRIPPNYDLSQITTPMYFFYSRNDWISSARDVHKMSKRLKSLKGKFLIADSEFNHLDYMFGIQAPKLVYNRIISLMTRH